MGKKLYIGNRAFDVKIVSWRPRWREGLTYQIRRLADGREWWIGAHYLRPQQTVKGAGDPAASIARW